MKNILSWPQTPLGPLWADLNQANQLTELHWGNPPANATLQPNHPAQAPLQAYFNGQPLNLEATHFAPQGTPFQQKVWQALLTIPHGKTVTYAELATRLSTHARAIGGAVGANPLPILIPCHRVMGTGGKLTGFSAPGGIATKSWLLKHEGISA